MRSVTHSLPLSLTTRTAHSLRSFRRLRCSIIGRALYQPPCRPVFISNRSAPLRLLDGLPVSRTRCSASFRFASSSFRPTAGASFRAHRPAFLVVVHFASLHSYYCGTWGSQLHYRLPYSPRYYCRQRSARLRRSRVPYVLLFCPFGFLL